MAKKNTLLYLDEELVDKAKEHDLNLSEIAENAIESRLFPRLSKGQQVALDFDRYLENLKEEGKCFELPLKIEEINLSNIGPIESLKETLGDFTVIRGASAMGKTIILHSIAEATLGKGKRDIKKLLKHGKGGGKIEVRATPETEYSLEIDKEKGVERNTKCILLDDATDRMDEELVGKFLDYLKEKDVQVIITAHRDHEALEDEEIKTIELKNQLGG